MGNPYFFIREVPYFAQVGVLSVIYLNRHKGNLFYNLDEGSIKNRRNFQRSGRDIF